MRAVLLGLMLALTAGVAVAQDWGNMAIISSTLGNNTNRLCIGEHSRPGDIGCPAYAPSLTTAGDLIVSGTVSATRFVGDGSGLINLSASGDRIVSGTLSMLAISNTGYISLSTAGVNWGYFSSGLSYLPTLSATTIGVSNTLNYGSQNIANVIGGGGNWIVSGSASVSTSSANGGTIRMANSSGVILTVSGSTLNVGYTSKGGLSIFGAASGNSEAFHIFSGVPGALNNYYYGGVYDAGVPAGSYAYLGGWDWRSTAPSPLILQNAGGNVGIGTTSPGALLHVNGSAYFAPTTNPTANGGVWVDGSSFGRIYIARGNADTVAEFYYVGSGRVGSIGITSTNTSYATTSDRRLKEHIVDTTRGLADLNRIHVEDFNFISDSSKTRVQGFIAQDIYTVYPEAVTVGGDDPKKKPWLVDYGRLTPLLVKSIQEQQQQIEVVKAANDNLRAQMKARDARDDELQRQINELKAARK